MVVGITGGIATGKSAVTQMLHGHGAITFSADDASRAILIKDGPVFHQLAEAFGRVAFDARGDFDRKSLGTLIFTNPSARLTLNRIMHPAIRRLLKDQICSAQDDLLPPHIIAVEVPLLFEGHMESWFERIVVVSSSQTIQLQRLMARSRLSKDEAMARINAQIPLDVKIAHASHVIVNNAGYEPLATQVDDLWQQLIMGSRV